MTDIVEQLDRRNADLRAEIERLRIENAELRKSLDTWIAIHGPRPGAQAMTAVNEIDRTDGIIKCTPQAVGELVNEIKRLREQITLLRELRAADQRLIAKLTATAR